MGLHFNIQVNGMVIGHTFIRRLVREPRRDVPNEYEYEVQLDDSLLSARATWYKGNVTHLYDDGPLVLIEKVMADIREGKARANEDQ